MGVGLSSFRSPTSAELADADLFAAYIQELPADVQALDGVQKLYDLTLDPDAFVQTDVLRNFTETLRHNETGVDYSSALQKQSARFGESASAYTGSLSSPPQAAASPVPEPSVTDALSQDELTWLTSLDPFPGTLTDEDLLPVFEDAVFFEAYVRLHRLEEAFMADDGEISCPQSVLNSSSPADAFYEILYATYDAEGVSWTATGSDAVAQAQKRGAEEAPAGFSGYDKKADNGSGDVPFYGDFNFDLGDERFVRWLYDGMKNLGEILPDGSLRVSSAAYQASLIDNEFNNIALTQAQTTFMRELFSAKEIIFNPAGNPVSGVRADYAVQAPTAQIKAWVEKFFSLCHNFKVSDQYAVDGVLNYLAERVYDYGTDEEGLEILFREIAGAGSEAVKQFKKYVEVNFKAAKAWDGVGQSFDELLESEVSGRTLGRLRMILVTAERGKDYYVGKAYGHLMDVVQDLEYARSLMQAAGGSGGGSVDTSKLVGLLTNASLTYFDYAKKQVAKELGRTDLGDEEYCQIIQNLAGQNQVQALGMLLYASIQNRLCEKVTQYHDVLGLTADQAATADPRVLVALIASTVADSIKDQVDGWGRAADMGAYEVTRETQRRDYFDSAYAAMQAQRNAILASLRGGGAVAPQALENLNDALGRVSMEYDIFEGQEKAGLSQFQSSMEAAEMASYIAIGTVVATFTAGVGAAVIAGYAAGAVTLGAAITAGTGIVAAGEAGIVAIGGGMLMGLGAGTAVETGAKYLVATRLKNEEVSWNEFGQMLHSSAIDAGGAVISLGVGSAIGAGAKTLSTVARTAEAGSRAARYAGIGAEILANPVGRGVISNVTISAANSALHGFEGYGIDNVMIAGVSGMFGGIISPALQKSAIAGVAFEMSREVAEELADSQFGFEESGVTTESFILSLSGALAELAGSAHGNADSKHVQEFTNLGIATVTARGQPVSGVVTTTVLDQEMSLPVTMRYARGRFVVELHDMSESESAVQRAIARSPRAKASLEEGLAVLMNHRLAMLVNPDGNPTPGGSHDSDGDQEREGSVAQNPDESTAAGTEDNRTTMILPGSVFHGETGAVINLHARVNSPVDAATVRAVVDAHIETGREHVAHAFDEKGNSPDNSLIDAGEESSATAQILMAGDEDSTLASGVLESTPVLHTHPVRVGSDDMRTQDTGESKAGVDDDAVSASNTASRNEENRVIQAALFSRQDVWEFMTRARENPRQPQVFAIAPAAYFADGRVVVGESGNPAVTQEGELVTIKIRVLWDGSRYHFSLDASELASNYLVAAAERVRTRQLAIIGEVMTEYNRQNPSHAAPVNVGRREGAQVVPFSSPGSRQDHEFVHTENDANPDSDEDARDADTQGFAGGDGQQDSDNSRERAEDSLLPFPYAMKSGDRLQRESKDANAKPYWLNTSERLVAAVESEDLGVDLAWAEELVATLTQSVADDVHVDRQRIAGLKNKADDGSAAAMDELITFILSDDTESAHQAYEAIREITRDPITARQTLVDRHSEPLREFFIQFARTEPRNFSPLQRQMALSLLNRPELIVSIITRGDGRERTGAANAALHFLFAAIDAELGLGAFVNLAKLVEFYERAVSPDRSSYPVFFMRIDEKMQARLLAEAEKLKDVRAQDSPPRPRPVASPRGPLDPGPDVHATNQLQWRQRLGQMPRQISSVFLDLLGKDPGTYMHFAPTEMSGSEQTLRKVNQGDADARFRLDYDNTRGVYTLKNTAAKGAAKSEIYVVARSGEKYVVTALEKLQLADGDRILDASGTIDHVFAPPSRFNHPQQVRDRLRVLNTNQIAAEALHMARHWESFAALGTARTARVKKSGRGFVLVHRDFSGPTRIQRGQQISVLSAFNGEWNLQSGDQVTLADGTHLVWQEPEFIQEQAVENFQRTGEIRQTIEIGPEGVAKRTHIAFDRGAVMEVFSARDKTKIRGQVETFRHTASGETVLRVVAEGSNRVYVFSGWEILAMRAADSRQTRFISPNLQKVQYPDKSINQSGRDDSGMRVLVDFEDKRLVDFLETHFASIQKALSDGKISKMKAAQFAWEAIRNNVAYDHPRLYENMENRLYSLGEFTKKGVCNERGMLLQVALQYLGIQSEMEKSVDHAWVRITDSTMGDDYGTILDPQNRRMIPAKDREQASYVIDPLKRFARDRLPTLMGTEAVPGRGLFGEYVDSRSLAHPSWMEARRADMPPPIPAGIVRTVIPRSEAQVRSEASQQTGPKKTTMQGNEAGNNDGSAMKARIAPPQELSPELRQKLREQNPQLLSQLDVALVLARLMQLSEEELKGDSSDHVDALAERFMTGLDILPVHTVELISHIETFVLDAQELGVRLAEIERMDAASAHAEKMAWISQIMGLGFVGDKSGLVDGQFVLEEPQHVEVLGTLGLLGSHIVFVVGDGDFRRYMAGESKLMAELDCLVRGAVEAHGLNDDVGHGNFTILPASVVARARAEGRGLDSIVIHEEAHHVNKLTGLRERAVHHDAQAVHEYAQGQYGRYVIEKAKSQLAWAQDEIIAYLTDPAYMHDPSSLALLLLDRTTYARSLEEVRTNINDVFADYAAQRTGLNEMIDERQRDHDTVVRAALAAATAILQAPNGRLMLSATPIDLWGNLATDLENNQVLQKSEKVPDISAELAAIARSEDQTDLARLTYSRKIDPLIRRAALKRLMELTRDLRNSDAEFSKMDVSGIDFSGYALSAYQAEQIHKRDGSLAGVDLQGERLDDVDLAGADLSGANLANATILRGNLSRANLSGANLNNALIQGSKLDGARCDGADFAQATVRTTSAVDATFEGAHFVDTKYDDNFSEATLRFRVDRKLFQQHAANLTAVDPETRAQALEYFISLLSEADNLTREYYMSVEVSGINEADLLRGFLNCLADQHDANAILAARLVIASRISRAWESLSEADTALLAESIRGADRYSRDMIVKAWSVSLHPHDGNLDALNSEAVRIGFCREEVVLALLDFIKEGKIEGNTAADVLNRLASYAVSPGNKLSQSALRSIIETCTQNLMLSTDSSPIRFRIIYARLLQGRAKLGDAAALLFTNQMLDLAWRACAGNLYEIARILNVHREESARADSALKYDPETVRRNVITLIHSCKEKGQLFTDASEGSAALEYACEEYARGDVAMTEAVEGYLLSLSQLPEAGYYTRDTADEIITLLRLAHKNGRPIPITEAMLAIAEEQDRFSEALARLVLSPGYRGDNVTGEQIDRAVKMAVKKVVHSQGILISYLTWCHETGRTSVFGARVIQSYVKSGGSECGSFFAQIPLTLMQEWLAAGWITQTLFSEIAKDYPVFYLHISAEYHAWLAAQNWPEGANPYRLIIAGAVDYELTEVTEIDGEKIRHCSEGSLLARYTLANMLPALRSWLIKQNLIGRDALSGFILTLAAGHNQNGIATNLEASMLGVIHSWFQIAIRTGNWPGVFTDSHLKARGLMLDDAVRTALQSLEASVGTSMEGSQSLLMGIYLMGREGATRDYIISVLQSAPKERGKFKDGGQVLALFRQMFLMGEEGAHELSQGFLAILEPQQSAGVALAMLEQLVSAESFMPQGAGEFQAFVSLWQGINPMRLTLEQELLLQYWSTPEQIQKLREAVQRLVAAKDLQEKMRAVQAMQALMRNQPASQLQLANTLLQERYAQGVAALVNAGLAEAGIEADTQKIATFISRLSEKGILDHCVQAATFFTDEGKKVLRQYLVEMYQALARGEEFNSARYAEMKKLFAEEFMAAWLVNHNRTFTFPPSQDSDQEGMRAKAVDWSVSQLKSHCAERVNKKEISRNSEMAGLPKMIEELIIAAEGGKIDLTKLDMLMTYFGTHMHEIAECYGQKFAEIGNDLSQLKKSLDGSWVTSGKESVEITSDDATLLRLGTDPVVTCQRMTSRSGYNQDGQPVTRLTHGQFKAAVYKVGNRIAARALMSVTLDQEGRAHLLVERMYTSGLFPRMAEFEGEIYAYAEMLGVRREDVHLEWRSSTRENVPHTLHTTSSMYWDTYRTAYTEEEQGRLQQKITEDEKGRLRDLEHVKKEGDSERKNRVVAQKRIDGILRGLAQNEINPDEADKNLKGPLVISGNEDNVTRCMQAVNAARARLAEIERNIDRVYGAGSGKRAIAYVEKNLGYKYVFILLADTGNLAHLSQIVTAVEKAWSENPKDNFDRIVSRVLAQPRAAIPAPEVMASPAKTAMYIRPAALPPVLEHDEVLKSDVEIAFSTKSEHEDSLADYSSDFDRSLRSALSHPDATRAERDALLSDLMQVLDRPVLVNAQPLRTIFANWNRKIAERVAAQRRTSEQVSTTSPDVNKTHEEVTVTSGAPEVDDHGVSHDTAALRSFFDEAFDEKFNGTEFEPNIQIITKNLDRILADDRWSNEEKEAFLKALNDVIDKPGLRTPRPIELLIADKEKELRSKNGSQTAVLVGTDTTLAERYPEDPAPELTIEALREKFIAQEQALSGVAEVEAQRRAELIYPQVAVEKGRARIVSMDDLALIAERAIGDVDSTLDEAQAITRAHRDSAQQIVTASMIADTSKQGLSASYKTARVDETFSAQDSQAKPQGVRTVDHHGAYAKNPDGSADPRNSTMKLLDIMEAALAAHHGNVSMTIDALNLLHVTTDNLGDGAWCVWIARNQQRVLRDATLRQMIRAATQFEDFTAFGSSYDRSEPAIELQAALFAGYDALLGRATDDRLSAGNAVALLDAAMGLIDEAIADPRERREKAQEFWRNVDAARVRVREAAHQKDTSISGKIEVFNLDELDGIGVFAQWLAVPQEHQAPVQITQRAKPATKRAEQTDVARFQYFVAIPNGRTTSDERGMLAFVSAIQDAENKKAQALGVEAAIWFGREAVILPSPMGPGSVLTADEIVKIIKELSPDERTEKGQESIKFGQFNDEPRYEGREFLVVTTERPKTVLDYGVDLEATEGVAATAQSVAYTLMSPTSHLGNARHSINHLLADWKTRNPEKSQLADRLMQVLNEYERNIYGGQLSTGLGLVQASLENNGVEVSARVILNLTADLMREIIEENLGMIGLHLDAGLNERQQKMLQDIHAVISQVMSELVSNGGHLEGTLDLLGALQEQTTKSNRDASNQTMSAAAILADMIRNVQNKFLQPYLLGRMNEILLPLQEVAKALSPSAAKLVEFMVNDIQIKLSSAPITSLQAMTALIDSINSSEAALIHGLYQKIAAVSPGFKNALITYINELVPSHVGDNVLRAKTASLAGKMTQVLRYLDEGRYKGLLPGLSAEALLEFIKVAGDNLRYIDQKIAHLIPPAPVKTAQQWYSLISLQNHTVSENAENCLKSISKLTPAQCEILARLEGWFGVETVIGLFANAQILAENPRRYNTLILETLNAISSILATAGNIEDANRRNIRIQMAYRILRRVLDHSERSTIVDGNGVEHEKPTLARPDDGDIGGHHLEFQVMADLIKKEGLLDRLEEVGTDKNFDPEWVEKYLGPPVYHGVAEVKARNVAILDAINLVKMLSQLGKYLDWSNGHNRHIVNYYFLMNVNMPIVTPEAIVTRVAFEAFLNAFITNYESRHKPSRMTLSLLQSYLSRVNINIRAYGNPGTAITVKDNKGKTVKTLADYVEYFGINLESYLRNKQRQPEQATGNINQGRRP